MTSCLSRTHTCSSDLLCIFDALCSWFEDMRTCVQLRRSFGIVSYPSFFYPPLASWQGDTGTHRISPKEQGTAANTRKATWERSIFLVDIFILKNSKYQKDSSYTQQLKVSRAVLSGGIRVPWRRTAGVKKDTGVRAGHVADLQLRSCTQGCHSEYSEADKGRGHQTSGVHNTAALRNTGWIGVLCSWEHRTVESEARKVVYPSDRK